MKALQSVEAKSSSPTNAARVEAGFFSVLAWLVDALPSSVQYGFGRTLRNRLLATPVAGLEELTPTLLAAGELAKMRMIEARVVLVTGGMGTGGVEAVVATLARRLPAFGIATTVLCRAGGATADGLRRDGIDVVEAPDLHAASAYLQSLPAGTVAQLHGAPAHLVEACTARSLPVVPVIHNTDINMSAEDWDQEARLVAPAAVAVAVSSTVRDFYLRHLPRGAAQPTVTVIPNGVDLAPFTREEMSSARTRLASLVGADLSQAVVFCCLARYELQKNLPGLVTSFLAASKDRENLHLVVAGPVVDWLEFRLADALRRTLPAGRRIHLLGNSSARTILAASDACLLDSFFEGWPVAATEAVCAGLPLVISDVGGATELVGTQGQRGHVFANPASRPDAMNHIHIRTARRHVRQQGNQDEMKGAVHAVADALDGWRARRAGLAEEARSWLSSLSMVRSHADLLKKVAFGEDARQSQPQRGSLPLQGAAVGVTCPDSSVQ